MKTGQREEMVRPACSLDGLYLFSRYTASVSLDLKVFWSGYQVTGDRIRACQGISMSVLALGDWELFWSPNCPSNPDLYELREPLGCKGLTLLSKWAEPGVVEQTCLSGPDSCQESLGSCSLSRPRGSVVPFAWLKLPALTPRPTSEEGQTFHNTSFLVDPWAN